MPEENFECLSMSLDNYNRCRQGDKHFRRAKSMPAQQMARSMVVCLGLCVWRLLGISHLELRLSRDCFSASVAADSP